jgi:tRNA-specific 2-thiouridylase
MLALPVKWSFFQSATTGPAREAGLPNWNKPDSQELCFVAGGDGPGEFIRKEAEALGIPLPTLAAAHSGPITDSEGNLLGRHEGAFAYTVGQRRGLGISAPRPLYVLEVRPEESHLLVGPEEELFSRTVPLSDVNLLVPVRPGGALPVLARIRSRHPEQPASLFRGPEGDRLVFEKPVRAAAPGQSAVFFDPERPERVLGGGVISGRCF